MIKKCLLIILVMFSLNMTRAQRQYVEKNNNYRKARIFQKGKSAITVRDLKLINDSTIQYSDEFDKMKVFELSTKNIRTVSVSDGTHALNFGLFGGLIGFLCSVEALINANNDPGVNSSKLNTGPIIAGFSLGGIGLGALIGVCTPKWKTLYMQEKTNNISFLVSPKTDGNYCGLGIKINF